MKTQKLIIAALILAASLMGCEKDEPVEPDKKKPGTTATNPPSNPGTPPTPPPQPDPIDSSLIGKWFNDSINWRGNTSHYKDTVCDGFNTFKWLTIAPGSYKSEQCLAGTMNSYDYEWRVNTSQDSIFTFYKDQEESGYAYEVTADQLKIMRMAQDELHTEWYSKQ